MALTVAEQQTGASNTGAMTFTLAATSAVRDLLVVIFADDAGTAASVQTPTGTAASAWTLQDTYDGGTGNIHIKTFTAPVTTAGATTVICTDQDNTNEHAAGLWRIPGGAFDVAAHANGTTSTSHDAPSLTPATADEIYCCLWTTSTFPGAAYNYTYPGGAFVAGTERDLSSVITYGFGYEPIKQLGPTGTRTAVATTTNPWVASAVLIKSFTGNYPPSSGRATQRRVLR